MCWNVVGRIRPIVLIVVVGLILAARSVTIARAQSGSIPAPPTDVRLVADDASTGDPAIVDSLRRHGISDLQLAREPITVPTLSDRPGTLQYGGVLAFNAARNSLFIGCHTLDGYVAEISIPESGPATFVQPCADVVEGRADQIFSSPTASSGIYLGGLLVWKDKLLHTAWEYYDADNKAVRSHFVSSPQLSTKGEIQGPFTLASPIGAGMVAKYMTQLPIAARRVLRVPAVTGMCCESIIARTSFGPALFGFDPDRVGNANPVPTVPLVYYDVNHPTLNTFQNTAPSRYFNGTSRVEGVVWAENSRTVFFFGYHGYGEFCYGPSTNDAALKGTPIPDGSGRLLCYEPEQVDRIISQNSTHAYPYSNWVWAYDGSDLVRVASGQKQPWEVKPFETGPLPGMTGPMKGASYDPATGRIFISTRSALTDYYPWIYTYRLAN